MRRLTIEQKEVMMGKLRVGESLNRVSREMGLGKSTIYYHYKKAFGRKYQLATIPEDDVIQGEILGAFAGDGNYYHRKDRGHHRISIGLSSKHDSGYAKYLTNLLENHFNLNVFVYDNGSLLSLVFNSRVVVDWIRDYLFIEKNKTLTVRLKEGYYSDEFIASFLRGLYDTDGHVSKAGDIHFGIISIRLILQMSDYLTYFGIEHSIFKQKHRPNEHKILRIRIRRRSRLQFWEIIGFSHPRKARRLLNAAAEI